MFDIVKPMDIEKRSFEIITELLGDRKLAPENELVIKRVIHTTADFEYVDNLAFSPDAVAKGIEALKNGCHIVTDTSMAMSGINKTILGKLGGQVGDFCHGNPPVRPQKRGVRPIFSIKKSGAETPLLPIRTKLTVKTIPYIGLECKGNVSKL